MTPRRRAGSSTAIGSTRQTGGSSRCATNLRCSSGWSGTRFRDPGLLEHALTHTSRANEDVSGGVIDNESLEFLGDAVLGFAIADLLFRRFPSRDEGWKSKMKAALVSTASLARLAEGLDLGRSPAARPRRGEDRRTPQTGPARRWLRGVDCRDLPRRRRRPRHVVHRTPVRRAHQRGARARPFPSAITSRPCRSASSPPAIRCPSTWSSGKPVPITTRRFRSRCVSVESRWRDAAGRSKKEAEQEAARLALGRLSAAKDL